MGNSSSYIDRMNQFNRWCDNHTLSICARILYYRLLDMFNSQRWPEQIQADNQQLLLFTGIRSPHTLRKAREELKQAGLIQAQETSNQPITYQLIFITASTNCLALSQGTKEKKVLNSDSDMSNSKGTSCQNIGKESVQGMNRQILNRSLQEKLQTIYQQYPRKVGKQAGIKVLKAFLTKGRLIDGKRIKLNHVQAELAVISFAEEMKGKDPQYISHFSSFMNSKILDYVENTREQYEQTMKEALGPEWETIRFIYQDRKQEVKEDTVE